MTVDADGTLAQVSEISANSAILFTDTAVMVWATCALTTKFVPNSSYVDYETWDGS